MGCCRQILNFSSEQSAHYSLSGVMGLAFWTISLKPAIDVAITAVNYRFAIILTISCLAYGDIAEIYRHRKLIAHRLDPRYNLEINCPRRATLSICCRPFVFLRPDNPTPVQQAIFAGQMFIYEASDFESDDRFGFLDPKLANSSRRNAFLSIKSYFVICLYKHNILASPLPPMCCLSLYYLSV